jgi:hypothetical protein
VRRFVVEPAADYGAAQSAIPFNAIAFGVAEGRAPNPVEDACLRHQT